MPDTLTQNDVGSAADLGRPLRIALTADPELPVPPTHYGGIERIVDMLVRGLAERGHEVTLFAHPESRCDCTLMGWPGSSSRDRWDTVRNALFLADHVVRRRCDIVHSFSRLAYLAPILPVQVPKLMTYQRAVSARTTRLAQRLSRGTLGFTAVSHWMVRDVAPVGNWDTVPNGVPLETYTFRERVPADAPLVFLGRLEEIKGPHLAIEIARRTNRRLILAGNVPAEKSMWFNSNIHPHIDGATIRYVGPVDDRQKNELLGMASALLMPILWEEPFGIVMAEAMACGTPVLGFRRGAVPEVVEDGVTGLVRNDIDSLVAAMAELPRIDRSACRRRVERFFSAEAVLDRYLEIYLARGANRHARRSGE